jgi:hypothetical protein
MVGKILSFRVDRIGLVVCTAVLACAPLAAAAVPASAAQVAHTSTPGITRCQLRVC